MSSAVFETLNRLTAERCSETGSPMHSINHAFQSEYFRKCLSYEAQVFFSKFSKFYVDSKNTIKYPQKIFGF